MARIEIKSFKVAFLLVSGLVMLSSVLAVAKDIVPLPPLPPKTHDFLEHCGAKLTPICGKAIEASVYKNGKLFGKCCKQLLTEGKVCHDMFVEVTAPFYPETKKVEIWAKRGQVWDHCVALESKN